MKDLEEIHCLLRESALSFKGSILFSEAFL